MNLLQSLALRTLGSAAIAPPRVPYVNVYPEEQIESLEARAEDIPASRPASDIASRPPGAQRTTDRWQAASEPRIAAPPSRAVPTEHSPRDTDRTPRVGESPQPPATRVVEHWIEVESAVVPGETAATPPVPAPATTPPPTPVVDRGVFETHHHHWVEHHTVPAVHVVEQVSSAKPAAAREVERPAVRPAPVQVPTPAPPRAPMVPPRVAAVRDEAREAPAPPAPSPAIHVAIGRVTVRLHPQSAPAKTETTRPVAPDLDLNAYTAEQRNRKR